jgi:PEP-CTERM motif
MQRSWKCTLWFLAALAPLSAGPVLTYELAGDFQLQESGNSITGHYQIQEKSNDNFYLIIREQNQTIVGELQLNQGADLSDDFEAEHLSMTIPNDYEIVLPGQTVTGDFLLQETGNSITGEYKLAIQTQTQAPEPGTLLLLSSGIGLIGLGRWRRTRKESSIGESVGTPPSRDGA